MILLTLGVARWTGAQLFKRIAPERRAVLGEPGKGRVTLLLVLSIVLMVVGYRWAGGFYLWGRTPALVGINNLLMVLAVYMFAASGMKTALARRMRHPMLGAVKVWALAHLLVNGDLASFILFGGLLAWAVVQMIMINRAAPDWNPPEAAPVRKEIMAVVGTRVVFGGVAFIHGWLGYPVFG